MTSTGTTILTAQWVFDGLNRPVMNGTVEIANGRIVSTGTNRGSALVDLGNVAIIPGLVNAHTHLDLTGMRGKTPPDSDFVGWLRKVISHRRNQDPSTTAAQIQAGIDECLRAGTTAIGDISAFGLSWSPLCNARCWSVVFREYLGLPSSRVEPVWTDVTNWLQDHPASEHTFPGISPHAPYSVNHKLILNGAGTQFPLAIHTAESKAELQLLKSHDGDFVNFLSDLGVWDEDGLIGGISELTALSGRNAPTLFVHGNYLPDDARISENATIIYCPRTHAAFGHDAHPFERLLERGVRVALGTDSLGSNPDLDVFNEVRFIYSQRPGIDGQALLKMATLNGAEALGLGHLTGSLEPGKSADLAVIPLEGEGHDPYELLFGSSATTGTRRAMWRGQWL